MPWSIKHVQWILHTYTHSKREIGGAFDSLHAYIHFPMTRYHIHANIYDWTRFYLGYSISRESLTPFQSGKYFFIPSHIGRNKFYMNITKMVTHFVYTRNSNMESSSKFTISYMQLFTWNIGKWVHEKKK